MLSGGGGGDFLQGDAGAQTLTGGKGGDQIHGKDGNGTINAADGGLEEVLCSRGIDNVVADRVDRTKACERRTIVESFFTVACLVPGKRCDGTAQIVLNGSVLATGQRESRELGGISFDFRYSRAALGNRPAQARMPVQVKLAVKQKSRTTRRTIPMILAVSAPNPGG